MESDAKAPDEFRAGTPNPRLVWVVFAVAALVLVLDQLSKTWAVRNLADGNVVVLIDGFLELRLTRNPGAAFSFATGFTLVFTVIAVAVVAVIVRFATKLASLPWALTLGALLGGALGNLMDRVFRQPSAFRGHVVDLIVPAFWPSFPTFNLADSAIVCAGVAMVVLSLLGIEYDGRHRTSSPEPNAEFADE